MSEHEAVVVLITVPGREPAEALARVLLERRLAACVNICEGVRSLFWWEGRIDEADEVLLIVKAPREGISDLIAAVRRHHPYSVPEVVALPIAAGNPDYLRWVFDSCKAPEGGA